MNTYLLRLFLTSACLLLLMLVSPVMAGPDCSDPKFQDNPKCSDDGDSNDSGVNIPLSCFFWDRAGDTLLSDNGLPYVDGEEKVGCSTGGTSQPNLSGIGLATMAKGNAKNRVRQLDIALAYCPDSDPDCIQPDNVDGSGLPASIFQKHDMEDVWFSVRPYIDQDHIQLLDPGLYRMALRVSLRDRYDGYRVGISMADTEVADDKFQGVSCDVPAEVLEKMEDVSVIVRESDDAPVRFTVTTGAVNLGETPEIIEDYKKAAICTDIPPCETADDYSLCFMGLVYMRFTFDASDLP